MTQYFLLVDQSTQWFCRLVAIPDDTPEKQWNEVPSQMRGDFLSNIYAREMWPKTLELGSESWGGWNISRQEYERIRRMIELWPAVQEYQKLQDYNV